MGIGCSQVPLAFGMEEHSWDRVCDVGHLRPGSTVMCASGQRRRLLRLVQCGEAHWMGRPIHACLLRGPHPPTHSSMNDAPHPFPIHQWENGLRAGGAPEPRGKLSLRGGLLPSSLWPPTLNTLWTAPKAPPLGPLFTTSLSLSWSQGVNGTPGQAQIGGPLSPRPAVFHFRQGPPVDT